MPLLLSLGSKDRAGWCSAQWCEENAATTCRSTSALPLSVVKEPAFGQTLPRLLRTPSLFALGRLDQGPAPLWQLAHLLSGEARHQHKAAGEAQAHGPVLTSHLWLHADHHRHPRLLRAKANPQEQVWQLPILLFLAKHLPPASQNTPPGPGFLPSLFIMGKYTNQLLLNQLPCPPSDCLIKTVQTKCAFTPFFRKDAEPGKPRNRYIQCFDNSLQFV